MRPSISDCFQKRITSWATSRKTRNKRNYLAVTMVSRRGNDRVIQNQSHRSAVDRVSRRRFASRVIHMFAASSISVIFIRFVSIERLLRCARNTSRNPRLDTQRNPLSSGHVPWDWRLLLFNTVNKTALWYTTNVRFQADLRLRSEVLTRARRRLILIFCPSQDKLVFFGQRELVPWNKRLKLFI